MSTTLSLNIMGISNLPNPDVKVEQHLYLTALIPSFPAGVRVRPDFRHHILSLVLEGTGYAAEGGRYTLSFKKACVHDLIKLLDILQSRLPVGSL